MRAHSRAFMAAFGMMAALQSVAPAARLEPASDQTRVAAAPTQAATHFRITVPQIDTELLIDGKAVAGTGTTREFATPPIEAGKSYEYKFTAKWRPNTYTALTRTKTVRFKGGDTVTVDLTGVAPDDRAVIRYVPTPPDIVREMVALAGVNKDDVVYEPGCGDARILIAAVKAGARKGVGIDIDPERVAESKANVKAANLDGRIDIRLADALDIDLSEASIVFLYMGNEFNMLFRPILWKQLKVGARVVSHRFTMGDWKPEQTIFVTDDTELEYQLHLWTITEEVKERIEKQ